MSGSKAYKDWDLNLDTESLGKGALRGRTGRCQRCHGFINKSGKSAKEALVEMGADWMVGIRQALEQEARENKVPAGKLGTYHTHPGGFVCTDAFQFDHMYKAGTKLGWILPSPPLAM